MRIDFRPFSAYGSIDVAHTKPLFCKEPDGFPEDDFRIHVQRVSGCVGEVIAYVAQIGSTEQCVADGMDEHVGIAVTEQPEAVFDLDAAEVEAASFNESVYVVSHSDAEGWDRGGLGVLHEDWGVMGCDGR